MAFAASAALRSPQVTAIPSVIFSGAVSGYLRTYATSDDSEAPQRVTAFAAFRAFQGEPNRMIGSGHRSNASIGSFVELNLGADKSFLERFASANSMTLGFSEKSWSLNMSGSREVTDEFSKCVRSRPARDAAARLAGNGPTQPYNPRDNDGSI